jgi:hypothetical protein
MGERSASHARAFGCGDQVVMITIVAKCRIVPRVLILWPGKQTQHRYGLADTSLRARQNSAHI